MRRHVRTHKLTSLRGRTFLRCILHSIVFGIAMAKTKPLTQGRHREKTNPLGKIHILYALINQQNKKKQSQKRDRIAILPAPSLEATALSYGIYIGEADSNRALIQKTKWYTDEHSGIWRVHLRQNGKPNVPW